ncbi:MAG: DNA replication/repair protein RecF [Rhodobacteraceae bacterium]|nr:DNA replication/repair protein RecF [Paracoccaceae bacterium]
MAQLKVTSLNLSHFRSYKHARIESDGGIMALYGPNGAGKTNILEAISLLSPGRGLRGASAPELMRRPEALGWKLTATLESLSETHEISIWAEGESSRNTEIDGKKAPQTALGRLARIIWLVPVMDRLWVEGAGGRRRFLDRMVMSFHPRHAEATLGYEKSMRERNRLLKDQVRDSAWYDALERQMAKNGAEICANRKDVLTRLKIAQDGAQSAFPVAGLEIIESPLTTEAELAEAFSAGRIQDLAAGRTLSGPHRADLRAIFQTKGVEARACSTGEQKALLISLILANARALRDDFGAPPILLLDEIAAHLDSTRRAALYDELHALNAQAWLTGTGHELFAGLDGRATMVPVSEAESGSLIGG